MRHDDLEERFAARLKEQGIQLSALQRDQFARYYELLVQWNKKMNLTAITERPDVYWKHFYDSLTLAFGQGVSDVRYVIDVGSGAGFPSLPLKIAFPHLQVTIVDSLNKRLTFLRELCTELLLSDVQTVHARAEALGQDGDYREAFDLVTARAVARLNVLSEYCLPFARVGGQFVAMKADAYEEELHEAERAIARLGGRVSNTQTLALPEQLGSRAIITITKEHVTPKKYPRQPGTPAKSPL
ncbi:16S rRNA (guanine(527)-N(7))-methyltransferase RsmG [Numidum massiliense]|uniref:16S rRNA (guanine(527)-N(7))-methyltransferase RsmG n=1 Tax=Numidum massiliense TaxID=1522315 RepID=UPI0006D52B62|nr:16S rRNA (guanine(527)-N(7))-methyltransferase RsmG [Numidum massiliense]